MNIGGGAGSSNEPVRPVEVKPACGAAGTCLPDDNLSCRNYVPPVEAGPQPTPGDPLDAGANAQDAAPADGGPFPAVDGSFGRSPVPDAMARPYACQLSLTGNASVERVCALSGAQGVEEACTSSMDCAPGLGCVGMSHRGRCLPFCCAVGSSVACSAGFFCTNRPLRVESLGDQDGPFVPVCDRADNCSLREAFPCVGERCVCAPDRACFPIGSSGTTACFPPGTNQEGDSCPCAAGHVCSALGRCMKTCDLDDQASNVCGDGRCQSTPSLPEGWGTCVGVTPR